MLFFSLVAILMSTNFTFLYIPSLSTENYTQVDVSIKYGEMDSLLILKNECKGVAMTINNEQARSIALGLEGKIDYRPTTHDIISTVFKDYGINVVMVKVTEVKNGTYFAKLFLKQNNKIAEIDVRPSDAVAIAVRQGAPIYVSNSLLENVC